MTTKASMAKKANFKEHKKIGPGQIILLLCVLLFTVFCFAPVLLVFISAFTDEMYINQHGFSFFPAVWSMNGMNSVLRYGSQLLRSYGVTIFITVVGTFLGLLVMSMYAYSISRHDFKLSKFRLDLCAYDHNFRALGFSILPDGFYIFIVPARSIIFRDVCRVNYRLICQEVKGFYESSLFVAQIIDFSCAPSLRQKIVNTLQEIKLASG